MTALIPRDRKFDVLCAVYDHCQEARYGPTVEELRGSVGLNSRSTVQFHLNHLLSDGYLSHIPGKRRSLRPTKKGEALIKIIRGSTNGKGS